jgi:hypothetical protein
MKGAPAGADDPSTFILGPDAKKILRDYGFGPGDYIAKQTRNPKQGRHTKHPPLQPIYSGAQTVPPPASFSIETDTP